MSNYTGTKCISCDEFFKDGDDVVVCPECGTPYHRECYIKEGQCINAELHEKGESWQPEYEDHTSDGEHGSAEPLKCIRCGAVNPPEGLFCNKCGMPLTGNQNTERPFNDQKNMNGMPFGMPNQNGFNQGFAGNMGQAMVFDKDSDIDGVKLDDYAKYTGKNQFSFMANFIRFAKSGTKVSLNIGALIFPELYFFYSKMPKLGVLIMILSLILSIPNIIYIGQSGVGGFTLFQTAIDINSSNFTMAYNLCSYLELGLKFLCGLFGTYWYYKSARKNILNIHNKMQGSADESQIKTAIAEKGGVSWIYVIVAVTIYFILTSAIMVALNRLA